MGTEEIDAILERTFYSNSRGKDTPRKKYSSGVRKQPPLFPEEPSSQPIRSALKPAGKKQEYLLVDGYNVIFAWERLKALAEDNLDGARMALLDMLCNYQAVRQCSLMVVFDAYRVEGHTTEVSAYHNIQVVFNQRGRNGGSVLLKNSPTKTPAASTCRWPPPTGWNRLSFWARDAVSSLPESWNRNLSG